MSSSQSNKSYAGLYATAIRLRTQLAVEYYAFHLWPHGTADLREIGQRLEAVAPEEAELYNGSRWSVLDEPFLFEDILSAAASDMYPFPPEFDGQKKSLILTVHLATYRIGLMEMNITDETPFYPVDQDLIRSALLDDRIACATGECLKPSGVVTKQLGFPTTTVPKFKPDAAAALKVSSIKIRKDVMSDPIADIETYLFDHKVALMPSYVNAELAFPWLTVERKTSHGAPMEARHQTLSGMSYAARIFLRLCWQAHRANPDNAVAPPDVAFMTYGLLLLGGHWILLVGRVTTRKDWLERTSFERAEIKLAVGEGPSDTLTNREGALHLARVLRNIAREASERISLAENWLWCLSDTVVEMSHGDGDDDGDDGDDDEGGGGESDGEDEAGNSAGEMGGGQGGTKRRRPHGSRGAGSRGARGARGTRGRGRGRAMRHAPVSSPRLSSKYLKGLGAGSHGSERTSDWVKAMSEQSFGSGGSMEITLE